MRISLLALPLAAALLLGAPTGVIGDEGRRVLDGEYRSSDGNGPVTATFTPSGSRLWQVRFDFTFNGRRHTYLGKAEGGFADGAFAGHVESRRGQRTFSFRLEEQEEGVYRGRHAEVSSGREYPTGTIRLAERD